MSCKRQNVNKKQDLSKLINDTSIPVTPKDFGSTLKAVNTMIQSPPRRKESGNEAMNLIKQQEEKLDRENASQVTSPIGSKPFQDKLVIDTHTHNDIITYNENLTYATQMS